MTSILKVDNIQNAAGQAAITIDSNGFVAPKLPCLSVALTSNTGSYSSNNYHLIPFSTNGAVDIDNTSAWNSANEKWQPQTAGYYSVSCCLTSGTGTIRAAGPILYKNGSIYQAGILWMGAEADGDDVYSTFTTLVYFNGSSDYIQLYGYIYDSVAGNDIFMGGQRRTSMTAHYVSS